MQSASPSASALRAPVHLYGEAQSSHGRGNRQGGPRDEGCIRVTGPDEKGVVVVEIAREEKYNAINLPMMKAMADLFNCFGQDVDGEDARPPREERTTGGDAFADRERERRLMRGRYGRARAAVLTGAGSRSFCSGVDLTAAQAVFQGDIGGDDDSPFVALASRCAVPVVAAINGAAFTAGLELAISCDVVVAGPSATFADTHCKYGIMPSGGASQRLPRCVSIVQGVEIERAVSSSPSCQPHSIV